MKIMGGFFMRNGRRTISVLLVAAMTAGLAACGTTEAAENVTESETPENTDYNFTVSYDGIQTGDVFLRGWRYMIRQSMRKTELIISSVPICRRKK